MEQMEIVDVNGLKDEIKQLRQSLDYWTGELKFKQEAEMAKIARKTAEEDYNHMWKSRSCYIEIAAILLMKLKNLSNQQEAFPILKKFFIDDYKINYQQIEEELNNDN